MAGQNHHFGVYAPEKLPYAIERYVNETNRLYGVLDRRLDGRGFIAGEDYTIADIASYPWIVPWQRQRQDLDESPEFAALVRHGPGAARDGARLCEGRTLLEPPRRDRGGEEDPLRADLRGNASRLSACLFDP